MLTNSNIKLLVLAGGFGTRLSTIVADVPKPLARIGEVPFLGLQLENWVGQEIKSFIFLLHHKANLIVDFVQSLQSNLLKECELEFLIEDEPMGTGGAIANAVAQLGLMGDFLVVNADTWLDGGINDLINAKAPSMAVVQTGNTERYGSVEIDEDWCVTSFKEKNVSVGASWINAGLYCLNSAQFEHAPSDSFSLEEICLPELAARKALKAVPLRVNFIDIGVPDDYYRMNRWVKANRMMKL